MYLSLVTLKTFRMFVILKLLGIRLPTLLTLTAHFTVFSPQPRCYQKPWKGLFRCSFSHSRWCWWVHVVLISAIFLFVSEDNELVRIILVKSGRDAANCWHSLLTNEYSADPWTFNEMEKKLTLERFQKEVHLARVITCIPFILTIV